MILVSTPRNLKKAILVKKLFYVSTMKGTNTEIKILCRNNHFQKTLLLSSRTFLRKENLTSSLLKEIAAFRETIRTNTISERIRGLITSRLIMITDIITCWLCQYCLSKQGNDSKIVAIKRQGVSSRASLFSKSVNQVNDCFIIWPPHQDIVL